MQSPDKEATFDIRRSTVLGTCMRFWGQPLERDVLHSKDGHPPLEFYHFPMQSGREVARLLTFGMSSRLSGEGKSYFSCELLFVFSYDFGGSDYAEVADYFKSIAVHCLEKGVQLRPGVTFDESPLAPKAWKQKALLVDEPLGEPEELETFAFGDRKVKLLWLIPIYKSEADFIKTNGILEFDRFKVVSPYGITDLSRDSFV